MTRAGPHTSIPHRFGRRHVLPIVQTIIYCLLAFWGLHDRYPRQTASWRSADIVSVQEDGAVEWEPRHIDSPPPRGFRVAIAINFPALVPAAVIIIPISVFLHAPSSFSNDVVAMSVIGLFVPFIWYAAGWWFDDRRGRNPPRLFSFSARSQTVFVVLGLVISIPILPLGFIASIAVVFGGWRHADVALGLFFWSAWIAYVTLRRAIRLRAHPLPSSQTRGT
jgi:hypothetical protein